MTDESNVAANGGVEYSLDLAHNALLGIDGAAIMDGKPVLTAFQLPPPATRPTAGPHVE